MSAPILLNLAFFMMIATISSGMSNYSVVALGALYGTPVGIANGALSAQLVFAAAGVLIGGLIVAHTTRHGLVAALGLVTMAATAVMIAFAGFNTLALLVTMSVFGFFFGFISPSRDMIVRAATPPGSFGKVFGFVTTGFNLGGIVAPLVFGAIMDHGDPRLVFLITAACALIAILTVVTGPRRAVQL
jgi:MFS family permease